MCSSMSEKRGSVLLEVLVGLLIFVVALVAVIGLLVSSLWLFADAQRSFVAARAAREGMEMVLAKHQNHILCQKAGDSYAGGGCQITTWWENLVGEEVDDSFEVDVTEPNRLDPNQRFRDFSGEILCTAVNLPDTGKFTQCNGNEAELVGNVTREVTIQYLNNDQAKVSIEVTWDRRRGGRASLVVETILFGPA